MSISLETDWQCPRCNDEHSVELDIQKNDAEVPCPRCGQEFKLSYEVIVDVQGIEYVRDYDPEE